MYVLYNLLEQFIQTWLDIIIDPQLPPEQAGYHWGYTTVDQVALLIDNIEIGFKYDHKVGVILLNLTAVYDTVWHRGPVLKMLQLIPDRYLVNFLEVLISNHSFILKTSEWLTSQQAQVTEEWNPSRVDSSSHVIQQLHPWCTCNHCQKIWLHWRLGPLACGQKMGRSGDDPGRGHAYHQGVPVKVVLEAQCCQTSASTFRLNNKDTDCDLDVRVDGKVLSHIIYPVYFVVKLDWSLTCQQHLEELRCKVAVRNSLLWCLAGTCWDASTPTLHRGQGHCAKSMPVQSGTIVSIPGYVPEGDPQDCAACLRTTSMHYFPVICRITPFNLLRSHYLCPGCEGEGISWPYTTQLHFDCSWQWQPTPEIPTLFSKACTESHYGPPIDQQVELTMECNTIMAQPFLPYTRCPTTWNEPAKIVVGKTEPSMNCTWACIAWDMTYPQ